MSSGPWRRVAGGSRLVAGLQLVARSPPIGLAVVLVADVPPPEGAHQRAVGEPDEIGGQPAVGVLLHEGHVLVREAGHRGGHADAAHVGAAPDGALPAADRDVALDDGALAAELDQAAVVGAVLGREIALLGEAGPVAALTHRAPEEPR